MDRRCRYHRQPDPRFFFLVVVLAIMTRIILLALRMRRCARHGSRAYWTRAISGCET
jgi:hypothetical protein